MPAVAPVLRTQRLTLRGHRVEDLDACAAMWADPVVIRHIGGRPFTPEEAWSKVLRYAGLWALLGFGYWVVEESASGRFVGEVGFADFHRDVTPSLGDSPEGGWVLATWAHGAGFATEALRGALAWTDQHLPGRATVCIVHPDNGASLRVADKCGYREIARGTYKGGPTVVFRRAHEGGGASA
jgi:RimJ/RimL family protein N-acetyltransferase